MAASNKIWKVVFFKSDNTFSIVNSETSKKSLRFDSHATVSVKFGKKWFEGEVCASAQTKEEAEAMLTQLTAENRPGEGKNSLIHLIKCHNI